MTEDYLNDIPDITYQSYGVTYDGEDDNLLNRNYFRFIVPRIPNFERFVRGVIVPPFRFGEYIQPTTLDIDIRIPGGSFVFQPLQVQFAVDERFLTYLELFKWMTSIGGYENNADIIPYKSQTSNASLLITNSAYKPQYQMIFKGLYPIQLGELDMTSAEPSSTAVITSVSFNFTNIEILNSEGSICDLELG